LLSSCRGEIGDGCPSGEYSCWNGFRCDVVRFAGLDCLGYRLPTEAEWEYAARAGSKSRFSTGNCITPQQARYDCSAPPEGCVGGPAPHGPVAGGNSPANPWGLHDIHGNVYEWVWDYYGPYEVDAGEVIDPLGPASGDRRIVRGGSSTFPGRHMRSADRSYMQPHWRADNDGFRLVRTIPAAER